MSGIKIAFLIWIVATLFAIVVYLRNDDFDDFDDFDDDQM